MKAFVLVAFLVVGLSGCSLPQIDLGTSEPIKVDINMRLDVYQYDEGTKKPPTEATPTAAAASGDVAEGTADRAADVQVFKNSRLVGEGADGLLAILAETTGENGDFVRDTVRAENAARMRLMKGVAEKEKRPLPEVQGDYAELWRNRSFSGEWVQVKGEGGELEWMQKAE